MPFELIRPPESQKKPVLKPRDYTGKYEKRIVNAFKLPPYKAPGPRFPGIQVDPSYYQEEAIQTPQEKVLDWLTLGHIGGTQGYEREISFSPQGQMIRKNMPESGTPGFLESPELALSFGAASALMAPGTLSARMGKGAIETMGYITGGATDMPRVMAGMRPRLIPVLPHAGLPGESRIRTPMQLDFSGMPVREETLKALPPPRPPKMEVWPGEYYMQEVMIFSDLFHSHPCLVCSRR